MRASYHSRRSGARRVIIKARIVKLEAKGTGGPQAHLRYIQRDGVTREGEPGKLYDAMSDASDGKQFLERGEGDRHQFRFIVSPEDGAELKDLKPFVRGLMDQMEKDLGTKLDWVAVDHFNTDNPHTHIVLRGKDEFDKDLVIARDYISHGMKARASELLTLELGPVPEHEIRDGLASEVTQDRFTRIDRELMQDADKRLVDIRKAPRGCDARFRHGLKLGRLQKLEEMGLAVADGPKRWRLSPDLEPTLRAMGERGDIIKTMHRELTHVVQSRAPADCAIFDPAEEGARLVGRVVARGVSDELHDRHYLIVDGLDGRTHYAEVGELVDATDYTPGAIVALEGRRTGPRQVDKTIAEIAERSGGLYGEDLHRKHHPQDTEKFVKSHIRRLEALRRAGIVERLPDGGWEIPDDYLTQARVFDERTQSRLPARLTLLSSFSLEQMAEAEGATWLDRELANRSPDAIREAGFGKEAREALKRRRQWLMANNLAREEQRRTIYARNMLAELRARDIRRAGALLSEETGLEFMQPTPGERVEGVYRKPLHLASGKFAIIEKSKAFTLVPWRDVLERNRGKLVSGVLGRGRRISWDLTRKRGVGGL